MAEAIFKSRKSQIMEVAARLFRKHGYAGTSMRQLAAEVGIEPASIYSHITGKPALLSDLCFSMANEFFEAVEPIYIQSGNVELKLKQMVHAHISVITENVDASAVFFHDWRYLPDSKLVEFKILRSRYEVMFKETIMDGMDSSLFRNEDENFVSLTLFSAMNWTYEWYKPNGKMKAEEVADHISNIIINGIKK